MALDTSWSQWLKQINAKDINERIDYLKELIKDAQQEIVILTILREAFHRGTELRRIAIAKANQVIDEAINEANNGCLPRPIGFNGEGGIRNEDPGSRN